LRRQDGAVTTNEVRDGVELTNLDQQLFDGSSATKRDLIDYLDAMADRMIPALTARPLSVIRVRLGQRPFMQKNLPEYTPAWVPRVQLWAESAKREVSYVLGNDRRTLLWLANQRAVEFHPGLATIDQPDHPTHLVLDIDPPEESFGLAVQAALLVRQALADVGMLGAVKTSGAKGLHVFVPIRGATSVDVAAATRALAARAEQLNPTLATTAFVRADRGGKVFLDSTRAGGATVVSVYSPRLRDGLPVSYPVSWDELHSISPADFTIHTAPRLPAADPWAALLPAAQQLSSELVDEGRLIPIARVQAMHEGKRRARARKEAEQEPK
jgi:bifunctional non-homologous end joining protein LigD